MGYLAVMVTLHDFHRPLGSLGLLVSPIGLGTVKLGRNEGVKYPRGFSIPEDGEVRALLTLAHDLGINLVDTAPAYGSSEERLGKLLPGLRSDWVIATKVGEEFSNSISHYDFTAKHAFFSVERSLTRLRTDYLDLVLVHSDGNDMAILEDAGVCQALEDLKRQGKIRGYGFSGKTVEGNLRAIESSDCAMVTFNPLDQTQLPVIEQASSTAKGILVKKALASGHLSQDVVASSFEEMFSHPGITSAIIGTITPSHLIENTAYAANALLKADEIG